MRIEILWALQLLGAIILALPTAWNREANSRIMGLRTFPLVAMGACAYIIIGRAFLGDATDAVARVLQGLLTGIGFVGGGAILKGNDQVKGTASAASIWITGALGAAVGFEYWALAVMLSVLNFLVIFLFGMLKSEVHDEAEADAE